MTEHWHLDKRVPIALILTIFLQSASAVWWASGMHEKMGQVERRLEGFNARNVDTDRQVQEQSRQIAVLTTQVSATNESLSQLRSEIRDTNSLLRDLIKQREPYRGGRE